MGRLRTALLATSLAFGVPAGAEDDSLDGVEASAIHTRSDFLSYESSMTSAFNAGDFIRADNIYKALEESGFEISAIVHYRGAQSALSVGKTDAFLERIQKAQDKDPENEEYLRVRETFEAEYAYQVLPDGELTADFELGVIQRSVLQRAKWLLKLTHGFNGYLPRGEYRFNGELLTVPSEVVEVEPEPEPELEPEFSTEVRGAIQTVLYEFDLIEQAEAASDAGDIGTVLSLYEDIGAVSDADGLVWIDMITSSIRSNHGEVMVVAKLGHVNAIQCSAFEEGTQDARIVERANKALEESGVYSGMLPECVYSIKGRTYDLREHSLLIIP